MRLVQGSVSELCCVIGFSNQSCQPVCKCDAQEERKRNIDESMSNNFHYGKALSALFRGHFCLVVFAFPTPGCSRMKPV